MTVFARKVCKGPCGRELSVAHGFYRSRNHKDGYTNVCKECKKSAVAENRELKADYYRQKSAERRARPAYRERQVAYLRIWSHTEHGLKSNRASRARYRRWKALEQRA